MEADSLLSDGVAVAHERETSSALGQTAFWPFATFLGSQYGKRGKGQGRMDEISVGRRMLAVLCFLACRNLRRLSLGFRQRDWALDTVAFSIG